MNTTFNNRPQVNLKPWELVPGTFVQVLGNFLPKGVSRFGMIKSVSGKQFVVALPAENSASEVALVNVHGVQSLRAATIEDVLQRK